MHIKNEVWLAKVLYLAKSGLKCPIWPYSVFMATGFFSQGQATVLIAFLYDILDTISGSYFWR